MPYPLFSVPADARATMQMLVSTQSRSKSVPDKAILRSANVSQVCSSPSPGEIEKPLIGARQTPPRNSSKS
jgi:hypothetical protein